VDITEVAQRSGLTASTLRFYEEKGLIASIGRRGLHRVFDPKVLERLALIALGRSAGFSLDEIALMFAPDGRPRIDRQMLAAKAEELDRTIRKLTEMRDGLELWKLEEKRRSRHSFTWRHDLPTPRSRDYLHLGDL
jgi:DNA-binding transcriptional MerR regulator